MVQQKKDADNAAAAALEKVIVVGTDDHSMIKSSPLLLLRDDVETKGTLVQATEGRNEGLIKSIKDQLLPQDDDHVRHGDSSHQHEVHTVVDCVIIGSGASGLQCASSLLEEAPEMSILILEARDRLGGRILTSHETRRFCLDKQQKQKFNSECSDDMNEVDETRNRSFFRDLGAAWVHGIMGDTRGVDGEGANEHTTDNINSCHYNIINETTAVMINPMVDLLCSATYGSRHRRGENLIMSQDINSSISSVLTTLSPVLDPVAEGNPWTRPYTILHKTGSIALFINGERVPNDSKLVSRAIQRHYDVLKRPSRHHISTSCNAEGGNMMLDNKELTDVGDVQRLQDPEVGPMAHAHLLPSKRPRLLSLSSDDENEDDKLDLLTPFYTFLAENWEGVSASRDSQLSPTHDETIDDGVIQSAAPAVSSPLLSTSTDERYACVGDFDGPHCKVKTGMITVLIPLIEKVCNKTDILHLGEPVIAVTADGEKGGRVCIETATGMVVKAKCCVSTIPLGCLQETVESLFDPQLSNEKLDAIQSVRSGSYKKVFLTFDHIFWPKEEPFIGLVRGTKEHQSWDPAAEDPVVVQNNNPDFRLPGNYLFLSNLWARDGIPCIEAVLSGDLGVWAYGKDDIVIRNGVIEFLEASIGLSNLSKSCVGCHVTRWEEDEYTRGSYSSCRLDIKDRHVASLRRSEWDGRLIFAGEATESAHMGSVHAALMSGKRTAKDVLAVLAR